MKKYITAILIGFISCLIANAQPTEPFQTLHGGSFSGSGFPASPDPLVHYRWNDARASDSLQLFVAKPVRILGSPASALTIQDSVLRIGQNADIFFDFGVEHAGWVEFDADSVAADLQVSISEYNQPAILNAGAEHPVKTLAPVQYGKVWRLELNRDLYEGVRFAWLHIRNISKEFAVKNFRLVCQVKPANYLGSFETNDTELNKIWYTGAYVTRLNFLMGSFSAILMERSDRHSWTGDAYPAQAASLVAFGNYDMIRQNLEYTSRLDNGIPAYPLYWVLSLVDYCLYSGDKDFLQKMKPNAEEILLKANSHFYHLPALVFLGWDERLGAGFENPDCKEGQLVYRFLFLEALQAYTKLLSDFSIVATEPSYTKWFQDKANWLMATTSTDKPGIHALSKAVNAGLGNEPAIRNAFQQAMDDRLNRLSYSPFNQYFLLQAMGNSGYYAEAIAAIRDCWGGQIRYGGTSFFEVFRPSWNQVLAQNDPPPNNQCGYTSLAHPWGAGVTKWLTENILGVRPLAPGFSKIEITPQLSRDVFRVQGEVPTPHGTIKASFNLQTGEYNLEIPKGTVVEKVVLPLLGQLLESATINGQDISLPADQLQQQISFTVKSLKAGQYQLRLKCSGTIRETELEPLSYTVSSFQVDSATQGKWKSRYGKQGHYFPGYDKEQQFNRLPAFMDSMKVNLAGVEKWDRRSGDPAFLTTPNGKSYVNQLVVTRDPIPTLQTFSIDLFSLPAKTYQVAVYFQDSSTAERVSVLELFDLKNLQLLAPVQQIKNYAGGKYLVFQATGPIRIRINQVRGRNAAVAGLFFDDVAQQK